MTGYYYGPRHAVEFYKGGWIDRARLPGDLPAESNPEALAAAQAWMARTGERLRAIRASVEAAGKPGTVRASPPPARP